MDAGERWLLSDVAGDAIYAWDSRGQRLRTTRDVLRRPVDVWVQEGASPERTVTRTIYGESHTEATARNLRGRPYRIFDTAGMATKEAYDFKGNSISERRQFAADYRSCPDWSGDVPLDPEVFSSSSTHDALNRIVTATLPDGSTVRPVYNEASLFDAVDVNVRGERADGKAIWTTFIAGLDYDARRQRQQIALGSGVATTYEYDPLTFRLIRLRTARGTESVQDLSYTYDPSGNVTTISDAAQPAVYFRNIQVDARNDYLYDAIFRLREATGREHLGQHAGSPDPPTPPGPTEIPQAHNDHPGDGQAMGRYVERYTYDAAGNMLSMHHLGSDPAHPGWTRTYSHDEASGLDDSVAGNRLSETRVGGSPPERCTYDAHGNVTSMPHLPLMRWNYGDRLEATASQVVGAGTPETTYYIYDGGGQRVRKVTERQAAEGATPTRLRERLYLGGVEIYREYAADGQTLDLERETLHVTDGAQRVALVETRTMGTDASASRLVRYQFANHLGSASLELSDRGEVISCEEYYPYGGTSYQAVDASLGATPKRYRYVAMERDEETGFTYQSARYYAAWTATWMSADPAGLQAGPNFYDVCRCNPIRFADPSGREPDDSQQTYEGVEVRKGLNHPAKPPQIDPNTASSTQKALVNEPPPSYELSDFAKGMEVAAGYASRNETARWDTSVGEPGPVEQFVPVWGSGRSGVNAFQHGDYGIAAFYGAMAVTDVFLVKSLASGGLKFAGSRMVGSTVTEGFQGAAPRLAAAQSRFGGLARRPLGNVVAHPGVSVQYVPMTGGLRGTVGRSPQVMGGYGSELLAKFGLAKVRYNVTNMTMELNQRLLSNLPELNSVIAHENYHVRFALAHPNFTYIGDRGLPIMRVYARYTEELGAYYAGGTALMDIPSRAYGSTVGAYGIAGELELMAPPMLAAAVGGAAASVTAALGSYQLGTWYFTPTPYVLPPLTPQLPREMFDR